MKAIKLLFFVATLLSISFARAQVVDGINYQAVAIDEFGKEIAGMDAYGNILQDKTIYVRFSIIEGSVDGEIIYQEIHSTNTDPNGLFSLIIGHGEITNLSPNTSILDIDWGNFRFYLKVELDTKGSGEYNLMGIQQMMAVPYSLYSLNSGSAASINGAGADTSNTNELQFLSITNDTIFLTNGGYVKLPPGFSGDYNDLINKPNIPVNISELTNDMGYIINPNDADADPANELQTISISNDTLFLTNGGFAKIPATTSLDWININNIPPVIDSVVNHTYNIDYGNVLNAPASLSSFNNDVGFITNPDDADSNPNNELQTLSISNDTIYLSNGGFVKLPAALTGAFLAPTVSTLGASGISSSSVVLNGIVNAHGLLTSITFEWGPTTAYGNVATATQSPLSGNSDTTINFCLHTLQSTTTYHFRVIAQNAVDIVYGTDMNFSTISSSIDISTNSVTPKGITAVCGGNISSDGGSAIIARGVCWGTNHYPNLTNSHTIDGMGVGSFSSNLTGLNTGTIYYVRSYAINSLDTAYGNEICFNSGYSWGSNYAGGIVFYNDGNGHGLVCATVDQSSSAEWGCRGTYISGTSTAISTGETNTNIIVANCSTSIIAARLCYNLSLNGFTDWYLPSRDELSLIAGNLHENGLGNFTDATNYWSSSEWDANNAFYVYFKVGNWDWNISTKSGNYRVRAIRAF